MNALPPVPRCTATAGRLWLRRIDELEPWFGRSNSRTDGPFRRQGSLRPDYDRIEAPTMLVGRLGRLYRTAMLRMDEHLRRRTGS